MLSVRYYLNINVYSLLTKFVDFSTLHTISLRVFIFLINLFLLVLFIKAWFKIQFHWNICSTLPAEPYLHIVYTKIDSFIFYRRYNPLIVLAFSAVFCRLVIVLLRRIMFAPFMTASESSIRSFLGLPLALLLKCFHSILLVSVFCLFIIIIYPMQSTVFYHIL